MNGRDIRICTIFAFAKMEFMEKLHPIMFAGTGSDVGKSIIAAAFCRIFKQDGYQPAPFKMGIRDRLCTWLPPRHAAGR